MILWNSNENIIISSAGLHGQRLTINTNSEASIKTFRVNRKLVLSFSARSCMSLALVTVSIIVIILISD